MSEITMNIYATVAADRSAYVIAVTERAKAFFPNNPYMRAILYCHDATVEGRGNPKLSPCIITPFIIGRAGYGKTSNLRQVCRDLKIGYREIKLGGITDIAEIFGMTDKTIHADGKLRTVLALPDWWPDPENNPQDAEGIVVFDDGTRCLPHIFQAVMQFVIDGGYNQLWLPEGWSCAMTGNPPDGEYNVLELDPAQSSRMLVMAYNRPKETFLEQCEHQDVDEDMKMFWTGHAELLEVAPFEVPRPDNNDRTKMIWNRVYPYFKHDRSVLMMVGTTMFGAAFVTTLLASLQSDQPIDPVSILYNWDGVEPRARRYKEERRIDLLSTSVIRLVSYLDVRKPGDIEEEAWNNLAHFGDMLPESDAHNLVMRLFSAGDGTNRGQQMSVAFKTALGANPKSAFNVRVAKLINDINRQLAA